MALLLEDGRIASFPPPQSQDLRASLEMVHTYGKEGRTELKQSSLRSSRCT